jgi:hypothetical protein
MTMKISTPGFRFGAFALVAGLAFTGCDGEGTGPDEEMTGARAEAIATFMLDIDVNDGGAYGMNMDPRGGSHEFSRSAPCPAGGSHSVSGSRSSSLDTDTRVLSTTWSTTQTHDDCAITHSRRDQQVTVVIDGNITASGSASYQLPTDRPGHGRELLSYSSSRAGSTTTTAGDRTRVCEINVTETFDPATGAFTVTGTVCGRAVNVTRQPRSNVRG